MRYALFSKACLMLIALSCWMPSAGAQSVFKCKNGPGKTVYSDVPCGKGTEVLDNRRLDANVGDMRLRNYRFPENASSQGPSFTVIGERPQESYQDKARRIRDENRNMNNGRGPTKAQMRALMGEPVDSGSGSPSLPAPVSPPAPSVITNCDSGGCWDNLGGRYNRGAGTTYIPSSGGPACQLIGGVMHCP
jgi:hypothetical protein